SGDSSLYSTARANLRRGIQLAKESYRRTIEGYLTNNDPQQMWRGIQALTNYKGQGPTNTASSSLLAEELNSYFACFETTRHLHTLPHDDSNTAPLSFQEYENAESPGEPKELCEDYSSAFNAIISDILVTKLFNLQFPSATCTWIKHFITNRPLSDHCQSVRLGPHLSTTLTLSTGSPQGCVLSFLLFALYTYDCIPFHPTNTIIKFADDTTVVRLISRGDTGLRRHKQDHAPLLINGECVETVSTIRFLGTHISADLSWTPNIKALVKKAQKWLHFLRVLRKNNLLLLAFYHASVEKKILTYCLGVWYASSTTEDRKTEGDKYSCPPWMIYPGHTASAKSRPSQETPHILLITCLTCCRLDGASV
ncbi:hypothetical protein QTP70_034682, partial [Hemibagrus guttatus]